MVADPVPEMAKDGAIGLVQLRAALLALGRVRLDQRDRHDAIVVAGHDLPRSLWRIRQEFERQFVVRVFGSRPERQFPPEEAIEQAVLGKLDFAPHREMLWIREVRDRVVVPACDAQTVRRVRSWFCDRSHTTRSSHIARRRRSKRRSSRCDVGFPTGGARSLRRRIP